MTLDEQYQKTIDDQRAYLLKLQDSFNEACDNAKAKAQERLKTLPAEDKEAREEVLQSQKGELEEALHTLKSEVGHSTRATMKSLEAVVREKEKQVLGELEREIEAL